MLVDEGGGWFGKGSLAGNNGTSGVVGFVYFGEHVKAGGAGMFGN